MLPTITAFEQALMNPKANFARLHSAVPATRNGRPLVSCTNQAFEAEIEWNERRYLLYLPLNPNDLRYIEELEYATQNRTRGPLIENRIYNNELSVRNFRGVSQKYDIILQEITGCVPLTTAIVDYRASDLRQAVMQMVERLNALGFKHNNLRPGNILISANGRARPIRYWHADWFDFTENDISQVLELLDKKEKEVGNADLARLPQFADEEEPNKFGKSCEINRVCRCNRYGFMDIYGYQVTPFIYTWATEFIEGRAIVAKGSKMGAIDVYGAKVIPVIYKTLEFDIHTGYFVGTTDKYRYLFNYDGDILRRTDLSDESPLY